MDITAIVNIYKRPHTLPEQIAAIKAQSIPPKFIMIWNNGNKDVDLTPYKADSSFLVFDNNFNSGVWSRFIIASLAPTEYVCIFDDDTIPGTRWLENCLTQMTAREALYGTIGFPFAKLDYYTFTKRYGWDGPTDVPKYVDIVGHSWFFKREWITKYFLRESPQIYEKISNGEDVHFSFMLQKYGSLPTIVPPHPASNTELWGSRPKTAWAYGCDGNSETGAHFPINKMFVENLEKGFRIMIQRQIATSVGDFNYFINKLIKREPFGLIRPADGEFAVLQNRSLTNIDSWHFEKGDRLKDDLFAAISNAALNQCYIGIGCEFCSSSTKEQALYYIRTFNINPLYLTFANIFVNKNWTSWISFLKEEKLPFVYIGPAYKEDCGFNVKKYIPIDPFLVNKWNIEHTKILDEYKSLFMSASNTYFFISAGPISKILISMGWCLNKTNTYIDVGSSLDLFMKGSSNRDYATNTRSVHATMECRFSPSLITL